MKPVDTNLLISLGKYMDSVFRFHQRTKVRRCVLTSDTARRIAVKLGSSIGCHTAGETERNGGGNTYVDKPAGKKCSRERLGTTGANEKVWGRGGVTTKRYLFLLSPGSPETARRWTASSARAPSSETLPAAGHSPKPNGTHEAHRT